VEGTCRPVRYELSIPPKLHCHAGNTGLLHASD
jgi:hypothetical protein